MSSLNMIACVVVLLCGVVAAVNGAPIQTTFVSPQPQGVQEGAADGSAAQLARWLAHNTTYGVVSTISHVNQNPFGNIFSFVDGTIDNSTGHIYFFVSRLDASVQDFQYNPQCALTLTEFQTSTSCVLDAEDPNCARLVFSGAVRNLTQSEIPFAKEAMFQRHPEMKSWDGSTHDFHFLTLNIETIWMVNHYGGAVIIPVEDYYAATPQKISYTPRHHVPNNNHH